MTTRSFHNIGSVALRASQRENGCMAATDETLAALVRRLREEAGLGVRALADKAGMSMSNLSRLEAGLQKTPRRDTLQRLAKALNAEPTDFLILAGYAAGDSLPSFTPYLRTRYGHLSASKRRELAELFDRIEQDYQRKQAKRGGRE